MLLDQEQCSDIHGWMQENYTIHYWSERHWGAIYDGSISYCRPQLVSYSTPIPFLPYTHFSGHYCHLHHDLVLCMHWFSWFYMSIFCYLHSIIGVGTGGGGGGEARAPPIFYPRDFINIHTCSGDCRDHSVYYVWPPQNGIASYAYAAYKKNTPKASI